MRRLHRFPEQLTWKRLELGRVHALDEEITIEARAIDVVRRVRLGGIAPRPGDESACARCDSRGACRKPRFAIAREDDDGGTAS